VAGLRRGAPAGRLVIDYVIDLLIAGVRTSGVARACGGPAGTGGRAGVAARAPAGGIPERGLGQAPVLGDAVLRCRGGRRGRRHLVAVAEVGSATRCGRLVVLQRRRRVVIRQAGVRQAFAFDLFDRILAAGTVV